MPGKGLPKGLPHRSRDEGRGQRSKSATLKRHCSGFNHIVWENNVDIVLWQHARVYSKDDIAAYIKYVFWLTAAGLLTVHG